MFKSYRYLPKLSFGSNMDKFVSYISLSLPSFRICHFPFSGPVDRELSAVVTTTDTRQPEVFALAPLFARAKRRNLCSTQPRSQSSSAISDVTSLVKLFGKIRARFQATSGHSDSANRPGYEAVLHAQVSTQVYGTPTLSYVCLSQSQYVEKSYTYIEFPYLYPNYNIYVQIAIYISKL